jgi:TatD DNase family protein
MQWFEGGVNLTNERFSACITEIIGKAEQAGVERLVVIATDLEHSAAALTLCERFPHQLQTTIGIHPHNASAAPENFIAQLRQLSTHPSVCAIGECGLDFNRNFSTPADQIRVFEAQLQLAIELQLPVYLHERDALTTQIQLLQRYGPQIPRLFSHCFTGGPTELAAYQALDCYIGVTGWVCDERRSEALRAAIPLIADDRLILETDAPYLVPRTLRPRPRFNEPCYLPVIADQVAQLRNQSLQQLADLTWRNATRLFTQPVANADSSKDSDDPLSG